jgi:hypothetical protein
MAEKIYTIPINEIFDSQDGCPMCRLHEKLNGESLEYIMGAAMMEPDVRIETNKVGFCREHFDAMLSMKNRLSLALMLESHLDCVAELLDMPPSGGKRGLFGGRSDSSDGGDELAKLSGSCFICERVEKFEAKYFSNLVWLWKNDGNFRCKLQNQPYFCPEHASKILAAGKRELSEKDYGELYGVIMDIEKKHCAELRQQITDFTKHFDHRSAGTPMGDERYSVENAADFLSGKNS